MFHGSIVALVTPMKEDGQLDYEKLERLIEWHIAAKTAGLVIAGTTGESATLSFEEKQALIQAAVKMAAGRLPVIAGTGTSGTHATIELTKMAMECGADACLLVTPYYNRPTQEGLYQHYQSVAKAVPIPQILYNVPSRTACDILADTVARLATTPNIIGIKEASGQIQRTQDILDRCPDNFHVYSGEDAVTLEVMKIGAKGVISVTANVAPAAMQEMCSAAKNQDFDTANRINKSLMGLHKNLFIEPNPIPVKWALQQMGLIDSGIRLPLTPLSNQYHEVVKKAMVEAGGVNIHKK